MENFCAVCVLFTIQQLLRAHAEGGYREEDGQDPAAREKDATFGSR